MKAAKPSSGPWTSSFPVNCRPETEQVVMRTLIYAVLVLLVYFVAGLVSHLVLTGRGG